MEASEKPGTRRVELEAGGWALVRRINVGDIKAVRLQAHERGWEDSELDSLFLMPRVIVDWSLGDVTEAALDSDISELDYVRIWATAKGVDVPNQSSPSSAGSVRRAKTATRSSSPSNG